MVPTPNVSSPVPNSRQDGEIDSADVPTEECGDSASAKVSEDGTGSQDVTPDSRHSNREPAQALDVSSENRYSNSRDGPSTSNVPTMPRLPEDEVRVTFSSSDSKSGKSIVREVSVNYQREAVKCALAIVFTVAAWIVLFFGLAISSSNFKEPHCGALSKTQRSKLRTCEPCGEGTLFLPLLGEYENSWDQTARAPLYFSGFLCLFMGMGIICDMFMDAIEEITSTERVVWRDVHAGARQKFRIKVWNPTMANLTLMALGSSAPEILLSATELIGNKFQAGKLGPSTIVGSAAFNLFVISAVCVSAIPIPETKLIEGLAVFGVTSTTSIFAYLWLLIILLLWSPNKVEVSEAVITLLFFPAFLIVAFLADKEVGPFKAKHTEEDIEKAKERISSRYSQKLPDTTLKLMTQQHLAKRLPISTKAKLRRLFTGFVTGGRSRPSFAHLPSSSKRQPIYIGFEEPRYQVKEDAGNLIVKVAASQPLDNLVQLHYYTQEGTAKNGVRYRHVEGYLSFAPGIMEKSIEIPIIDDDQWEPDEEFYIHLADLKRVSSGSSLFGDTNIFSGKAESGCSVSSSNRLGYYEIKTQMATITVLNDDEPGTLGFDADEVFTTEGETVHLGIFRVQGNCGSCHCKLDTEDDTAVANRDYVPYNGYIEFASGETLKTIGIDIMVSKDHMYENNERFRVRLSEGSPGVRFASGVYGNNDCAICDVVIGGAGTSFPHHRVVRCCCNVDHLRVSLETWHEQIREALYVGGSPEEQASASIFGWFSHIIALIFKILFLAVPPSRVGGGWCRFLVSLFMIGLVTAIAGDISSLLGCCLGIPDDITAITLVALGTSLPDTLASKAAAQQDETADDAVGNITGSNTVNVFLGIGISWTIGAVYWERDSPPSEEWRTHTIDGKTLKDLYESKYPNGGFFVPTNTLPFSVSVYVAFAFMCLGYLRYRRWKYGGEIGGSAHAQRTGFIILLSMWVCYVLAVSIYSGLR